MSIYRGKTTTEVYLASSLYESIEDNNLSAVCSLLQKKRADPNIVLPSKGIASFHLAIGNDSEEFAFEVVSLILQTEGNPNVRSDDGLTPVHIAAAWGRLEILNLLLRCGGNPELRDCDDKNALDYAAQQDKLEVISLLQEFIAETFILNFEVEPEDDYKLTLEKVLVNTETVVGEYEIKDNCVDEALSQNTDYVQSWCDKHSKSVEDLGTEKLTSNLESEFESPSNVTYVVPRKQLLNKTFTVDYQLLTSDEDVSSGCGNYQSFRVSGLLNSTEETCHETNCACANCKNATKTISKDCSSDYFTSNSIEEPLNRAFRKSFDDHKDQPADLTRQISEDSLFTSDNSLAISNIVEVYKYEDKKENLSLFEKRPIINNSKELSIVSSNTSLSSKLSSLPDSFNYDTDALRKELSRGGCIPGPIIPSTKRAYLRKLHRLKEKPTERPPLIREHERVYSSELEKTFKDPSWVQDLSRYKLLEEAISKQFNSPDPSKRWREGVNKSSFTYLLLDPRVTNNLPCRADSLQPSDTWKTFLGAIFYVGKGKRTRPYSHLYDAVTLWNVGKRNSENKKLKRILNIWNSNSGVVCLHVYQNIIPVEAYSREAAMISALKIDNVENIKFGDFYGVASTWTGHERRLFGVYLLYRAMMIFLNEGERQLHPADIN